MDLEPGKVAVVTGAASGIGAALTGRFASRGMHVVIADVDEAALDERRQELEAGGAQVLAVRTDVSVEDDVTALASATLERFGAVHVVCNNAGVTARTEPWTGPMEAWHWVMGVNFWGVIHGVRAFMPYFVLGGGGHFVNTASIAGLMPGFGPSYDASKHAVVAASEDLYLQMQSMNLPVGVSVLCPGWVRTRILDADRNYPGGAPEADPSLAALEVFERHVRRAIDEGIPPAVVADQVLDAVVAGRFWVIVGDDFFELAVRRWERLSEKLDPEQPEQVPGLPPQQQIIDELQSALGLTAD